MRRPAPASGDHLENVISTECDYGLSDFMRSKLLAKYYIDLATLCPLLSQTNALPAWLVRSVLLSVSTAV
jgi:hypothetical protein